MRSSSGLKAVLRRAEPLLVAVALLALWELLARSGRFTAEDVPSLLRIAERMAADVQSAKLWVAIGQTLGAWALGLAIVTVVAIPVGLLIGSSRWLYAVTQVQLEFFRMIPSIAALPLLLFVFGVGFSLTVTLVVLTAIWPLVLQAVYGAHDVDPVTREMARVHGLGPGQIFVRIVLPSALPYILTGLRISSSIALIIAIATTLVVGGDGLGDLIGSAAQSGQTDLLFGRILVAGLLGLVVSGAVLLLERKLLFWHPSQRPVAR